MTNKEQNSKNGHTYRATWKDYSEPTIYLLTMNTEDREALYKGLPAEYSRRQDKETAGIPA